MSTKKKLALALASLATFISSSAFAQDPAAAGTASNSFDMQAMAMLGAGICMGLAALGGGMGQGRAAAAALEGISRNPGAAPRIQTPMIIGLALIESIVLFSFAMAYLLQGKGG